MNVVKCNAMNVVGRNQLYLKGILQGEGLFPHLEVAPASGFFNWDFGLAELPREAGIIVIRGPRQYGKSTWLEYQLRETLRQFGPGTALFLNGDYIAGPDELESDIESLMSYFPQEASVRRLFIDEITAVAGWQKAIKRLADRGVLRKVLLITTGSKASDIQREAELLPGRKGKLARTIYLFVQLPYKIFYDKAFPTLKAQTLPAYLIAGGSPPACAAVLETGSVPEYVFQTTADWIYGECALAGRSRPMLLRLLEQLMRRGASPIAQTTLAEESGMANNTVAHGYLDLLSDSLGSRSQRALGSGSKGASLTQGLQVSIRQSSRCEYLVDKPSHDTNLVGKIHRRGKGCVVGMGSGLGIIPTSRERGPSVTLAVAVLAF